MERTREKWSDNNGVYYDLGEGVVVCDTAIYNYDDDAWRFAPDIYYEYITNGRGNKISREEAKRIIEDNGGNNFEEQGELLFVKDKEGLFSGV